MADDFESFDNLDDLDWSDVEDELKANKAQILSEAAGSSPASAGATLDSAIDASLGGASPASKLKDSELDIGFLLDVQLQISVEVGRTRMLIHELLQLNSGSIIELKSLIGQPLDIRVNDELIARGDIVVINDKFGIKITEILSPDERFASLT